MAHYAFLNKNNIVTEVIVGKNENEDGIDWENWYGNFRKQVCKRTSYNTRGGKYLTQDGKIAKDQSKSFRKNYAGKGFYYDEQKDAFIPPKPFPSWILNEDTCLWDPPTPMPTKVLNTCEERYVWNETTTSWVLA